MRIPRIVVRRPIKPRTKGGVPAVVTVGQVRLVDLRVNRRRVDPQSRLPGVVERIGVQQDMIGVNGDLCWFRRQHHFHTHILALAAFHTYLIALDLHPRNRHHRHAHLAFGAVVQVKAHIGWFVAGSTLFHVNDDSIRLLIGRAAALQRRQKAIGRARPSGIRPPHRFHCHLLHRPIDHANAVQPIVKKLLPGCP